ncbi:DUF4270 family protein [Poritiphilus flavus]|uniref:DUF4270 family protein n=1 Tax=Poritiphilus flavus TaxID=2697053 RepID=A0A6L9EB15_9FLAO|nr:DUF4270 family protein [Poritiphilus flavus]NAS11945.1 DUF4270 family protein [Poritiphilus flavus]
MKRIFLGLFILIGIMACSIDRGDIPTLEVGQDFADSDVRLLVLDTFSVKVSTFKFDSINTSSSDRLLLGQYEDEYFGTVTSSAFFELVAATPEDGSARYNLPEDVSFDSIALILGYDRYFYSDTLQASRIRVHELKEEVIPEENDFYNTSTLEFDSIPIAIHDYFPRPFKEDSVHITLPLEFGQQLFDLILENEINDDDELRDFLKGFSLQPGEADDGAILGFSRDQAETYLRIFYSVKDEFEDEEEVLDLVINPFPANPVAFNRIQNNTSSTFLDSLDDQETELLAEAANDLGYIQSGTGYAVKVEFPSLKEIYQLEGTGTTLSAILTLKPLDNSFDDSMPLRDSLNINVLNQNNIIIQEIRNGDGLVYGRITGEEEEFAEVVYEVPVGIYVDGKLKEIRNEDTSLVLFTQDYNQTVNRALLQAGSHPDFQAELRITYAIYDE